MVSIIPVAYLNIRVFRDQQWMATLLDYINSIFVFYRDEYNALQNGQFPGCPLLSGRKWSYGGDESQHICTRNEYLKIHYYIYFNYRLEGSQVHFTGPIGNVRYHLERREGLLHGVNGWFPWCIVFFFHLRLLVSFQFFIYFLCVLIIGDIGGLIPGGLDI